MLETIALIVFILLATIGVGLTLIGIGGTVLIAIGAALYNLIIWNWSISLNLLALIVGLALLGELLEWIITYYGVKKHGVTKFGLIGMIAGAFGLASLLSFLPLIGTVIGFFAGAIFGAFIGELLQTYNKKKAWKAAKAALMGRGLVILCKVTIAAVQIVLVIRALV